MTVNDRRRHKRYPFDRDLEIWAAGQRNPMVVKAHDISQSGFSFVSTQSLTIGDELVLGLRDVGDYLVKATVKYVRYGSDGYVVGAERLEIS